MERVILLLEILIIILCALTAVFYIKTLKYTLRSSYDDEIKCRVNEKKGQVFGLLCYFTVLLTAYLASEDKPSMFTKAEILQWVLSVFMLVIMTIYVIIKWND